MSRDPRKAALATYKERKPEAGVFVLRHGPSGRAWVGATPTLGTIENRLRFERGMGGRLPAALRALWTIEGDAQLEVLDRVEPERVPFLKAADYRAMAVDWAGRIGADLL